MPLFYNVLYDEAGLLTDPRCCVQLLKLPTYLPPGGSHFFQNSDRMGMPLRYPNPGSCVLPKLIPLALKLPPTHLLTYPQAPPRLPERSTTSHPITYISVREAFPRSIGRRTATPTHLLV